MKTGCIPFGVGGIFTPGFSSTARSLCCPAATIGMVKLAWKLPNGPTCAAPALVPLMLSIQIHAEPPGVNFEPRSTTAFPTSTTESGGYKVLFDVFTTATVGPQPPGWQTVMVALAGGLPSTPAWS